MWKILWTDLQGDQTVAQAQIHVMLRASTADSTSIDQADRVNEIRTRDHLHRIVCMWWWRAREARLSRELEAANKAALARWRATVVQQLESAERAHDSCRCWECARALAGTGVQARRRRRGSCRGECPVAAEWERHLSSDGPNGGQSVYTLWTGDADAIKTVSEHRPTVV